MSKEDLKVEVPDNFIITIMEDNPKILQKWRDILGENNVNYFDHPDDFISDYRTNPMVSNTSLVICNYIFYNVLLPTALDFIYLENVLKYKGKFFIHSSSHNIIQNKHHYDFIFPSKDLFLNKEQLFFMTTNFESFI